MLKSHYTQIGKEMDWHPLEQGVFGDARKIKIAVVGIGREAGASFIAANLAYHLAKHVDGVTYMEAENAQIAKTLEGRRHACYSLGLNRALGLAGAIEREGALKIDCAFAPEHRSNLADPTGHEPPSESAGSLSFRRERECDRALGLERPTEHGRDQTHTADRNRESARPRDHDWQPVSEWPTECGRPDEYNCQPAPKWSTECGRVSEHDCDHALGRDRPTERERPRDSDRNSEPVHNRAHASGRIREPGREWSHAFDWNREPGRLPDHGRERSCAFDRNHESDRPTELDHKCRPDCPSDAFSVRGRRGKFTDYFGLEKEGLPAGSRRNLYANVNWAVRAPLGAAPLEAAPSESRRDARSHAPFSEASTDTQQGAPLRQPRLRPAASEPCILAATQGIGRIPGRYMIVDNPRPESLWKADLVICVVDPLPSRLRSGMQQLEALRDNQIRFGRRFSPLLNLPSPVLWLLNKDNPQVKHRELERSLNIKFDFAVPLIPSEIFYKAEYSSVPIFQMVEADVRPHPSGSSDKKRTRTHPLAPQGADGCGGSPHSCCDTGAGKAGGRGFWQTGRAPAGASAGGSSGQPQSGCAAACSEFGRLAKRVLKLLD